MKTCPSCGEILSKEKKTQTTTENNYKTNYNSEKKVAPSVTANYNCAEAARKLASWYRVFRVFYVIGMVAAGIGMLVLIITLLGSLGLLVGLSAACVMELILYIGYLFIKHHIEFYDEQYALNTALAAWISEENKRK